MNFPDFLKKHLPEEKNFTADEKSVSFVNKNGKKFILHFDDIEKCLYEIYKSGKTVNDLFKGNWTYEEAKFRNNLGEIFKKIKRNTVVTHIGSQTPNTVRCLELYAYFKLNRPPTSNLKSLNILKPEELIPIFNKSKDFEVWLKGKKLSEESIKKYINAISGTLSKIVGSPIFEIFYPDKLNDLMNSIKNNPEFIKINKKGNSMYNAALQHYSSFLNDEHPSVSVKPNLYNHEISSAFQDTVDKIKIKLSSQIILNFIASQQAKPFLLFTGLSGSGKTLLAQAFVKWITPKHEPTKEKDTGIHKGKLLDDGFYWQVEEYHIKRDRMVLKKSFDDTMFNFPDFNKPEDIKITVDGVDVISRIRQTSKGNLQIYGYKNIKDWLAKIGVGNFFKVKIFPTDGKFNNILAFEQIAQPEKLSTPGYCLLSVGANWTSKEDILGYPDALDSESYILKPALRLLLEATKEENKDRPFFLILDEMNLSHVERYFADFLSAMESNEVIELHEGPAEFRNAESDLKIPQRIEKLPSNFFIIGTVNVDETTYMFSPKVLDRANVIEFRAEKDQIMGFLNDPSEINLDDIAGNGIGFAQDFVAKANMKMGEHFKLEDKLTTGEHGEVENLRNELELLFAILAKHEAEFGFRTAKEISRFVYFHKLLTNDDTKWKLKHAVDAQIMQKILPKMHGSKKKLWQVLVDFGNFCFTKTHEENQFQEKEIDEYFKKIKADKGKEDKDKVLKIHYPVSFEKIIRMLRKLKRDGFASFAEA